MQVGKLGPCLQAGANFTFEDFVSLKQFLSGGPGRSPTADLRVRSALLYATELPGHVWLVYRVGYE
jgi:hypothetical protein